MNEKTCSFTGHRPQNLPFGFDETDIHCKHLKQRIERCILRLVEGYGVRRFCSGMALGVDLWASESVLRLRQAYSLNLTAIIPCPTQTSKWQDQYKQRHQYILHQCDDVQIISDTYTPNCIRQRNQALVDQSDYILGVYSPDIGGGTGQTLYYAKQLQRKTIVIHPVTLAITANFKGDLRL